MLKIFSKIKEFFIKKNSNSLEMAGNLFAKKITNGGVVIDLGLIANKMVTNAGAAYLVDAFQSTGAIMSNFYWHDCGTSTGAEAVGDTDLGSAIGETRSSGTQEETSAMVYKTIATHTFASTGAAITEHGIFSSSSSGILWDRSLFAAINVSSGDSIQFTYELTVTPGG